MLFHHPTEIFWWKDVVARRIVLGMSLIFLTSVAAGIQLSFS